MGPQRESQADSFVCSSENVTTSGSKKEPNMSHLTAGWRLALATVGLLVAALMPHSAHAACCYFSAKDKDILQPAQKVFITWNPEEKVESFTVQPKFEGNADDF